MTTTDLMRLDSVKRGPAYRAVRWAREQQGKPSEPTGQVGRDLTDEDVRLAREYLANRRPWGKVADPMLERRKEWLETWRGVDLEPSSKALVLGAILMLTAKETAIDGFGELAEEVYNLTAPLGVIHSPNFCTWLLDTYGPWEE